MKENLKPCVYKLWKHIRCDRVLFVERSGELHVQARLSGETRGAAGKPSVKSAKKSVQAGPKPGDLPMPRMKFP